MGLRTRTRTTRDDRPRWGGALANHLGRDEAIVVAAIVVGIVGAITIPQAPDTVHAVTITNPSEYDIEIDVARTGHAGWLPIGMVDVKSTRDFSSVLDQGDDWTLRFHAQGVDGGEQAVKRRDLAAQGWHLTIPDSIITRLRTAGTPAGSCAPGRCG